MEHSAMEPEDMDQSAKFSGKKTNHPLGCYGKRNPDAVILERQKRLYRRQLEGLTTRQLVLDHAARESISEKTAWMDWRVVSTWNQDDWQQDRETIVSRLQGMRFRAINQALKKGQLQTAQQLMKDLGAVVGEVAPEAQAAAAPSLQIVVEDRRKPGATDA